jgi:hypothetical protein
MDYYQRVLVDYEPGDPEDDRRTVLESLWKLHGTEHLVAQMKVLYRYICYKNVSFNILADVKWLQDRM